MTVLELGREAHSVAEIESLLAQLRRRASAQAREAMLPARAAVLNVVVYATREVHAERAAKSIRVLADRHPSRALVLFQDHVPAEPLDADVTLHCHLPQAAGTNVRYEQIVVRARTQAAERLRSIVIPLLIPDLPVFLWWTGTPPFATAQFRDLLGLVDRLVVDSADFARPERELPELLGCVLEARGGNGVTDLNWTRLTPWRELLAQFFDVPAWRLFLDRITGLHVSFAVDMDGRAIHPSQALLLLGWLAARLGWFPEDQMAPSEAGGLLFRMRRPDGAPLWVRVQPRFRKGVDEGDLTSILLNAEGAAFEIGYVDDESPHVATAVRRHGGAPIRRTVLLPKPSVVELLGEEFTITGSDATYEEALSALCSLT